MSRNMMMEQQELVLYEGNLETDEMKKREEGKEFPSKARGMNCYIFFEQDGRERMNFYIKRSELQEGKRTNEQVNSSVRKNTGSELEQEYRTTFAPIASLSASPRF